MPYQYYNKGQSFGEGLMQGFSFVEGIANARAQRKALQEEAAYRKRSEQRLLEDREREFARQENADIAESINASRAAGKPLDQSLPDDLIIRLAEMTNGDKNSTVTSVTRNDDGTLTFNVSGKRPDGSEYKDMPMTEGGTPLEKGGKIIRVMPEDLNDLGDQFAVRHSAYARQRIENNRQFERNRKVAEQDAVQLEDKLRGLKGDGGPPARSGPAAQADSPSYERTPNVDAAPEDYFEALTVAVPTIESGNRHIKDGEVVTSKAGAKGAWQIMDATGRSPGYGVQPLQNDSEEENRRFGRDYLTALFAEFGGDVDKALAAYNAGPGAVHEAVSKGGDKWLTRMPEETRKYVPNVRSVADELLASNTGAQPAAAAPGAQPAAAAPGAQPAQPAQVPESQSPQSPAPEPLQEQSSQAPSLYTQQAAADKERDGRSHHEKQLDMLAKGGNAILDALHPTRAYEQKIARSLSGKLDSTVMRQALDMDSELGGFIRREPHKFYNKYKGIRGDLSAEERGQLDHMMAEGLRARAHELYKGLDAVADDPAAYTKAQRAARRAAKEAGEAVALYRPTDALGLPNEIQPGEEVATQLAERVVPAGPTGEFDAAKGRAARTQVSRASDRNVDSQRPVVTKSQMDAAIWLTARGHMPFEAFTQFAATGSFQKPDLHAVSPYDRVIDFNTGRVINEPSQSKLREKMLEEMADMEKELDKAELAIHKGNKAAITRMLEKRYDKHKGLAVKREQQLYAMLEPNAQALDQVGLKVWDEENQRVTLKYLDEGQLSVLVQFAADNADANDQYANAGTIRRTLNVLNAELLGGERLRERSLIEGIPAQASSPMEGQFQTFIVNLTRAAESGNEGARAALERGEEFLRQKFIAGGL